MVELILVKVMNNELIFILFCFIFIFIILYLNKGYDVMLCMMVTYVMVTGHIIT